MTKHALRALAIAAIGALCAFGLAAPAQAQSWPKTSAETGLRSCHYGINPNVGDNAGLCVAFRTVAKNTPLTMLCWIDDRAGKRWFMVKLADGPLIKWEGFIEANHVWPQVSVKNCAVDSPNKPKFIAGMKALEQVDHIQPRPEIANIPGYRGDWGATNDWSGDCIKLAHWAFVQATGRSFSGNAIDVFQQYDRAGLAVKDGSPPPYGAMVFFNTPNPEEHVGIAVGGIRIVNTKGNDGDNRRVTWEETPSIGPILGWVPVENAR